MNWRRSLLGLLVLFSGASYAGDTRNDWFYDGGYFHKERGNNWEETIGGSHTYDFVEIGRDGNSVSLYDQSRDMHVRLTATEMFLGVGNQPQNFFRNGAWDTRRIFQYEEKTYGVSRFIFQRSNLWRNEVNDGTRDPSWPIMWKEVSRGPTGITILNPQTNQRLHILASSIKEGLGAALYRGGWVEEGEARMTNFEAETLRLVNEQRAIHGQGALTQLTVDIRLVNSARGHVGNMARQRNSDHKLDGKEPAQRMLEAGYYWQAGGWVAENIYYGQGGDWPTPQGAVRWWMNSPGHRAAILDPHFKNAGIGVTTDSNGNTHFCINFGGLING